MGTIRELSGTIREVLGTLREGLGTTREILGTTRLRLGNFRNRIARLPAPLSLWVILSKGTQLVIEDGVEQQLAELRGLLCWDLGSILTGNWREF